jgi:hypothetical protein
LPKNLKIREFQTDGTDNKDVSFAVLEFYNNLGELRTEEEQGCRTGSPVLEFLE